MRTLSGSAVPGATACPNLPLMLLAHELVGPERAPQIVLIHGITETRHTWRPLIDALQRDRRVLAVDLRGHGESDAADAYDPVSYATDVVETAASAGVTDRPLVVGHSLGGVVAAAYQAAGGACCGIVAVDQPLQLSAFKEALAQLEPMLKGSPEDFAAARQTMFAQMDGALPAGERQRFEAHARPDQDVVLRTWSSVFDSTEEDLDRMIADLTSTVTVPFLSVHGIDPGAHYAEWLTKRIPTATVDLWDEHGHYPHLVDMRRFSERIAEFEAQVRR